VECRASYNMRIIKESKGQSIVERCEFRYAFDIAGIVTHIHLYRDAEEFQTLLTTDRFTTNNAIDIIQQFETLGGCELMILPVIPSLSFPQRSK